MMSTSSHNQYHYSTTLFILSQHVGRSCLKNHLSWTIFDGLLLVGSEWISHDFYQIGSFEKLLYYNIVQIIFQHHSMMVK